MGITRRNDSKSWFARSSHTVNGKRPNQTFSDKKYGGRKMLKDLLTNGLHR